MRCAQPIGIGFRLEFCSLAIFTAEIINAHGVPVLVIHGNLINSHSRSFLWEGDFRPPGCVLAGNHCGDELPVVGSAQQLSGAALINAVIPAVHDLVMSAAGIFPGGGSVNLQLITIVKHNHGFVEILADLYGRDASGSVAENESVKSDSSHSDYLQRLVDLVLLAVSVPFSCWSVRLTPSELYAPEGGRLVMRCSLCTNNKPFLDYCQDKFNLFLDYFFLTFFGFIIIMTFEGGGRMITYKIDVIETLKESGYNATRILRENLISQSAMQKIRKGEMVGIITLDQICKLLDMQPGNIIKYVEDEK